MTESPPPHKHVHCTMYIQITKYMRNKKLHHFYLVRYFKNHVTFLIPNFFFVSGAGGSGRNNVNVRLASTALHLLRHLPGAREAVFEYYAGGPQVTEYVSRNVQ
jgi:hypothetical protein